MALLLSAYTRARNVRIIRLQAAHNMLCHLNSQTNAVRSSQTALITYASLVWLINGLHNKPPSDQTGRAVSKVALPLTLDLEHDERLRFGFEADDEDDDTPFCPGGMVFLREMIFPPHSNVARLTKARGAVLPDRAFKHMFGQTMEDLQREMNPMVALRTQRRPPANRFKVPRGRTLHRVQEVEEPMPQLLEALETIPLLKPDVEWGHDMEAYHEPLDEENQTTALKADAIWKQFPSDILQKVGNPMAKGLRRDPSYCTLNESERLEATIDRFKNKNLGATFRMVNVKFGPQEQWTEVFDRLFPSPNHQLPATHQHYKHMRYYLDWVALMGEIRPGDVIRVRRAMKKLFDELQWAPCAQNDRVWSNRKAPGFKTYPTSFRMEDAPRIIWNPKLGSRPEWVDPEIAAQRQEEEEEEEEEEEDVQVDQVGIAAQRQVGIATRRREEEEEEEEEDG